jgi:hypothetical protein
VVEQLTFFGISTDNPNAKVGEYDEDDKEENGDH